MITTASQLIDALGGTGAVAALLGVKDNTVSTWRLDHRGLPAWACGRLRDAARAAELSVDHNLFEIRAPGRVRGVAWQAAERGAA